MAKLSTWYATPLPPLSLNSPLSRSNHLLNHVQCQGSMDINGNNREMFDGRCSYTGCDVLPGNNVDVALPVHMLPHADASFDVVMSTGASVGGGTEHSSP